VYYILISVYVCFVGWRVAAQVTFALGYITLYISLCLAIAKFVFGCFKQKVFSKETCPFIFGVLIAVASKFQMTQHSFNGHKIEFRILASFAFRRLKFLAALFLLFP